MSGRDQIRETENNFVGAFAQACLHIKKIVIKKIVRHNSRISRIFGAAPLARPLNPKPLCNLYRVGLAMCIYIHTYIHNYICMFIYTYMHMYIYTHTLSLSHTHTQIGKKLHRGFDWPRRARTLLCLCVQRQRRHDGRASLWFSCCASRFFF